MTDPEKTLERLGVGPPKITERNQHDLLLRIVDRVDIIAEMSVRREMREGKQDQRFTEAGYLKFLKETLDPSKTTPPPAEPDEPHKTLTAWVLNHQWQAGMLGSLPHFAVNVDDLLYEIDRMFPATPPVPESGTKIPKERTSSDIGTTLCSKCLELLDGNGYCQAPHCSRLGLPPEE